MAQLMNPTKTRTMSRPIHRKTSFRSWKQVAPFVLALCHTVMHTTIQAQWQELGSGITNTPRKIFSLSAVDENIVWAVAWNPSLAAAYDFTVTLDGGSVWNAGTLPDLGAYYPGQIHAMDGQTAWALMISTPQQDHIKILKTTDGGANWQDQPGEFNTAGFAFACVHFFNANEGIGFGSPGTGDPAVDSLRIYRTVNGGDNWTRIPANTLPAPAADEGQWVFGDNRYEARGDTLWFCTRAGRVFRTTDKGAIWQAFSTGLTGSVSFPGAASIAFENSLRGIVTSYSPSRVARTDDGGETWTSLTIPTSPPAGDIEYVPGTASTYFVNKGHLNTSNTTSAYLVTHDSGDTWEPVTFTPALPVIRFLSPTIGFSGGSVTSSTQGGIYKWVAGPVGINDVAIDTPQPMAFPNPTKGTVTFHLPEHRGPIGLVVLDATGRTVLTRLITNPSASFTVDLNGLSNGLYFLQVETTNGARLVERLLKE